MDDKGTGLLSGIGSAGGNLIPDIPIEAGMISLLFLKHRVTANFKKISASVTQRPNEDPRWAG